VDVVLFISMSESTKSIVRKTSISPKSTWIKFDANGHSSFLDVDKYEIMRQVCIDARDLRILDPLLSYPSTILGREEVIVLNLEVGFTLTFFLVSFNICRHHHHPYYHHY
jgi:magnesium transporter